MKKRDNMCDFKIHIEGKNKILFYKINDCNLMLTDIIL